MAFTIIFGVLAWLLAALTSPVVVPVFLVLYIIRTFVVKLSQICRPDLKEPIKDLEISFSADKFWSRPLGANAFVWILEGPVDMHSIKSRVNDLLTNPRTAKEFIRLTSVYPTHWLTVPFWGQAKKFSMTDHVAEDYSRKFCSERDLTEFVAEYLQKPFKKHRPCWDILYVEDCTDARISKDKFCVFILRVHHVVGDGLSMLNFLERISDVRDTGTLKVSSMLKQTVKSSSQTKEKLVILAQSIFWTPLVFLHQAREFGFHSDIFTLKKFSNDLLLSWTTVPFESVRHLRPVFQKQKFPTVASYNWIIAGVIRQYFVRELSKSEMELRKATNVIVSLPAEGVHRGGNFQNLWTHGIFRLPVDGVTAEARKYMIINNCKWVSRLNTPKIFRWLLPLQRLLPYSFIKTIVAKNMGAPVGLTNISGPRHPVYLGGQKVMRKFAVVGLQWPQAAASNGFFTYNGELSVTFLVNNEKLGSRRFLRRSFEKYFHEELQQLRQLASNKRGENSGFRIN